MNIVSSIEKSPSPTSLKEASKHSPYRSPSPTLRRSTSKKSISPISLIQNLEKNVDDTSGSPDCSSVNSVCTVKELSPCCSKSDPIKTTPKKKLDNSPRTNGKISKIPRLSKPIHKKVVDLNDTASTSKPSSPRFSKDSPIKKHRIPRPTTHPKTSTPFGTLANNIIIAQVVTTDTSNQGFKLHTKAAVEIDREYVDSKLKTEPKSNLQKNSSDAASGSTPKANAIDNTKTDDKLSITTERTEIKPDAQELTPNTNDCKQTEDAVDVYNTIDLSSTLNAEPKTANEECGAKITDQEVFTPEVIPCTESIADTMFTVTDTDVLSFRSISSDNEYTEAHDCLKNATEIQDIFDRRKQVKSQVGLVRFLAKLCKKKK